MKSLLEVQRMFPDPTLKQCVVYLRLAESVIVQPDQECFLEAETSEGHATEWPGIVEATEQFRDRTGLMTCAVWVAPGQRPVPICVTNIGDKPIRTYWGQHASLLTEISSLIKSMVTPTSNRDIGQGKNKVTYDPTADVKIGSNLAATERQQLTNLLKQNADVFKSEGNCSFTTTIQHTIPATVPGPIIY